MLTATCDTCGRHIKCKPKKGYIALFTAPATWFTTPLGNFCKLDCWHRAYYDHAPKSIDPLNLKIKEVTHHAAPRSRIPEAA